MGFEDIKHIEVLLKSYKVMSKTLEIRLALIKDSTPHNDYMKNLLLDKLNLYNLKINELEKKLSEAKVVH